MFYWVFDEILVNLQFQVGVFTRNFMTEVVGGHKRQYFFREKRKNVEKLANWLPMKARFEAMSLETLILSKNHKILEGLCVFWHPVSQYGLGFAKPHHNLNMIYFFSKSSKNANF